MKMLRLSICLLFSLSLSLHAEVKSIRESMEALVKEGSLSGSVTLLYHAGKVVSEEAVGFQDLETKTPMAQNSVFWIASMTKPITALAVMML